MDVEEAVNEHIWSSHELQLTPVEVVTGVLGSLVLIGLIAGNVSAG
jgi:hypothetical protein